MMLTISLEALRFYAGHGIYREEDVTQNEFLVDASVTIDAPEKIDRLDQTVDYQVLYELVRRAMTTPAELLETIASGCLTSIKEAFPMAKVVEIKIRKLHPPMGGEIGSSAIRLIKHFD